MLLIQSKGRVLELGVSHLPVSLRGPAPSEETLLFLLPFIFRTNTVSARTASLTEHMVLSSRASLEIFCCPSFTTIS